MGNSSPSQAGALGEGQLRFVLVSLRDILLAHPRVLDDEPRVRFVGFADFSLNVEVRVDIKTSDRKEFRAIREDIFLRIWAQKQTGIDPMATAAAPTQQQGPAAGGSERVGGAARGALGGLAIGAIAGDAGKGATIGGVAGTMAGGHRARQNKAAQQQQAAQAKSATLQHFNNAFGACMEARGYTVK